jgi:hypothetical protein
MTGRIGEDSEEIYKEVILAKEMYLKTNTFVAVRFLQFAVENNPELFPHILKKQGKERPRAISIAIKEMGGVLSGAPNGNAVFIWPQNPTMPQRGRTVKCPFCERIFRTEARTQTTCRRCNHQFSVRAAGRVIG